MTDIRRCTDDQEHDFGDERRAEDDNGTVMLVAQCRRCNVGSARLERAPEHTLNWFAERLEGWTPVEDPEE